MRTPSGQAPRRKESSPPLVAIRVLVADDHPVVRRGLEHVLGDTPDIEVVGEASNASEVVERVRTGKYDVVLLDLAIPGALGVEVVESVKRERPDLPVLVLSFYPEDQYAARVMRAGAAGYMTKETAADELVQAIRKVHAGGRYVTDRVAETLAVRSDRDIERPPHELLSNREYQVLCLFGRALSVKQVAQELRLSEKTVSTYRSRLLEKMQARSTAELIRYAVQHRLVD